MSRWIKVYDRESQQLVDKEEYDKLCAARSKPYRNTLKHKPVRGIWVYDRATGKCRKIEEPKKIEVDAPWVKTDEIPPTESMATPNREMFTSKARLREHYRQHGFIETGGERFTPPKPPKADPEEIRNDVAKALNDLRWGNVPITEKQRELCKQEQRMLEQYKRNH